jgi:hypothetical protein
MHSRTQVRPWMTQCYSFGNTWVPLLDVSAHQRTIQDSEGYFGGDWAERQGFSLETIAYQSLTKSIVLGGRSWGQEEAGAETGRRDLPRPESAPFSLSIPLPTVKLDEVKLEQNPYYEEFKRSAEVRDKLYPFSYSSTAEWWITFSNGRENNYAGLLEIGLPVESQATGQRVLKALMHAIDLAGDRKAEPF